MSEVRFYLEKRKDKETGELIIENVPILLFYSFNNKRLQFYTGLRVDAKKWDKGNMQVKKNYAETSEINKEIDKLKVKLRDIEDRAKALGEKLSPQYFKDRLSGKKKEGKTGDLIWEYYQEFLTEIKLTLTPNSIKGHDVTHKTLKTFCSEKRWSLTFDSIDSDFFLKFYNWCFNEKEVKVFNNTTGTYLNKFRAFLNWSVRKGYNTNLEFRKQKYLYENTEIIYLLFEEVMKFYKHKFKNDTHTQVRDLYCLGCFTGIRYSDITKLQPENILEDKIMFRIKKTKEPNIVPLNKYSRAILDRNKGIHPTNAMPFISGDAVNSHLKNAMKAAGLTRVVQIIHFKGAERFDESKPLWDAATFHTSKKTFVTNFLEKGGSLTTAMAITGNKGYRAFKRYFKIADQFKASEMQRVFGK